EWSFTMAPGDAVIFYTDGVTEAQTSSGSLYGDKRLQCRYDGRQDRDPQALCRDLLTDVREFCRDAPQYDDITILAFRVNEFRARSGSELMDSQTPGNGV
ncbi:MAG TPA: PP2C family protein-serine/threonine phosphatase, partial [Syntrophales bacterium]|nr:PP2C family protein-serine/threonine phosphatase [Syntrophales bacterium]